MKTVPKKNGVVERVCVLPKGLKNLDGWVVDTQITNHIERERERERESYIYI